MLYMSQGFEVYHSETWNNFSFLSSYMSNSKSDLLWINFSPPLPKNLNILVNQDFSFERKIE